jgi:RNA polymerase sigma factor (sigma-70 family)
VGALNEPIDLICEDNRMLILKVIRTFFPAYQSDDDMIQEAWIGLWKASQSYDGSKSSYNTFATLVIKRRCCDVLKRRRRVSQQISYSLDKSITDDASLAYHDIVSDGEDVVGNIMSKIIAGEAIRAVKESGLSQTAIRVLEQRTRDFTYSQISERIGVSVREVSNSMNAIKDALKGYYLASGL